MNKLEISTDFETNFLKVFNKLYKNNNEIVLMCIGTDRIIGDSFGPLIGYNLKKYNMQHVYIEGDINNVISESNILKETYRVYEKYINPFVICVDSCLSSIYKEKTIIVEEHGTIPGSSLRKNNMVLGDMSIKGVVASYSKNNYSALFNVKLNTIIGMVDIVVDGLKKSLYNI